MIIGKKALCLSLLLAAMDQGNAGRGINTLICAPDVGEEITPEIASWA